MEDFKDKFQKQIEDLITHYIRKENMPDTDPAVALDAMTEILMSCASGALEVSGKTIKTIPLPDARVSILQIVPESLYIEANRTLDEHIARKNKNKETMH